MKTLNEIGFAELLRQANYLYVPAVSQDRRDWGADIAALEDKATRGDSIEIEVGSMYTKDHTPKFISLSPAHFDDEPAQAEDWFGVAKNVLGY
jgi:hypothetical protein